MVDSDSVTLPGSPVIRLTSSNVIPVCTWSYLALERVELRDGCNAETLK